MNKKDMQNITVSSTKLTETDMLEKPFNNEGYPEPSPIQLKGFDGGDTESFF